VLKKFLSVFLFISMSRKSQGYNLFDYHSLQFLMIVGDNDNMTCIFHFFAIKICQLLLFKSRTKR